MKARSTAVTSQGGQDQLTFNESSFARRSLLVGPVIDALLGACTAAKYVGFFKTLYVVNTTTNVLWVSIGDSSVVAGSDVSSALPVLPQASLLVSTGSDSYVIASGIGLGFYSIQENITVEM